MEKSWKFQGVGGNNMKPSGTENRGGGLKLKKASVWGVWIFSGTTQYLRNRKHVPCFYRVIETRVKVWGNEKCCGNTSRRRVFPQLFRVLPNFHSCFYNSIRTQRTCFLFLLENTATKKKKNNFFTSIIKM